MEYRWRSLRVGSCWSSVRTTPESRRCSPSCNRLSCRGIRRTDSDRTKWCKVRPLVSSSSEDIGVWLKHYEAPGTDGLDSIGLPAPTTYRNWSSQAITIQHTSSADDFLDAPFAIRQFAPLLLSTGGGVAFEGLARRVDRRTTGDVAREVGQLVESWDTNDHFSTDDSKQLRKISEHRGGWTDFKTMGITSLSGKPLEAATSLLEHLAAAGLLVVPFGELENFHREVPTTHHGASWLAEVTERRLHESMQPDRREFIDKISSR